MNCQEAANLISARIDGELSSSDQLALEAHLAQCNGCRAMLQALTTQHADLQRSFVPHRAAAAKVAERTIREIHRVQTMPWRFSWMTMVVSAAAGFAIAIVILQPWKVKSMVGSGPTTQRGLVPPISPVEAVAHLSLATGPIEILPPGESTWRALATGASIEPETRVRTPDRIRCEFVMNDGSEVRLNGGTELAFTSPRTFSLARGQIFSSVIPAAVPFTVAVAQASVTALGTLFDILTDPKQTTMTVLQGSIKVKEASGEQIIASGEQLSIVEGKMTKDRIYDLALSATWVNELLAMKGRDNQELGQRVNDLLARLGQTKMEEMYEGEIRALGDHCVLPLSRYIQSDLSKGQSQQHRRVAAARILADVAQPWSIPELIALLQDPDGDVRYYAARGLQRLTAQSHGRSPEEWRDLPVAQTRENYQRWQTWWERNKSKYPAGPITTPPIPNMVPDIKAKADSQ